MTSLTYDSKRLINLLRNNRIQGAVEPFQWSSNRSCVSFRLQSQELEPMTEMGYILSGLCLIDETLTAREVSELLLLTKVIREYGGFLHFYWTMIPWEDG